ncbi:hypothetical protein BCR39DRAFT_521630 [Naematelia encephala]|uniref:Uncharacterized protein n=1 Tax=Naematelia encephala TaxID=71784 RepID=A0A1Y2BE27_9TREE|nr:hypothetical protein BCR39DRAFT_521630 [Naematelia encephala]
MPKRKSSNPCSSIGGGGVGIQQPSVACFDAALDLLACDTFSRLDQIKRCFEDRAGIQFDDGIVQRRWDEAVKRYWVMKSMDELCCSMRSTKGNGNGNGNGNGEMDQEDIKSCVDEKQRQRQQAAASQFIYPGVISAHALCPDEAAEWRRWVPKVGDVVLVQLEPEQIPACSSSVSIPGGTIWPGKIIDKRMFFQGRTVPRGNHFFPVRVYHESIPPTITIKSRLLPFHLRPEPPLLANEAIQSAYHHAKHPESFDLAALARETQAAYQRTHPGVVGATLTSTEEGDEIAQQVTRRKKEKEEWNRLVNWVMNERRIEKLRTIEEERGKRLKDIAKSQTGDDELGIGGCGDEIMGGTGDSLGKKRRVVPLPDSTPSIEKVSGHEDRGGIFKVSWGRSSTPTRNSNSPVPPPAVAPTPNSIFGSDCNINTPLPSLASFIRPALSTPQRPLSPRRLAEKKRSGTYTGVGEYSPRGRGHTYTPPRILPSGDETAPSSGSPAPSRNNFDFDFVSPLGRAPVRAGKSWMGDGVEISVEDRSDSDAGEGKGTMLHRRRTGSLEAVKEEDGENEILSSDSGPGSGPGSGSGWTVVGGGKRGKRSGSAPCSKGRNDSVSEVATDGMDMKE